MNGFNSWSLPWLLLGGLLVMKMQLFAGASSHSSHTFQGVVTREVGYAYLQFLPKEYKESQRQWPLMLFLHGAGERGNDLEKVKVHGPPKIVADNPDFPFVLISPQCPSGEVWDADALLALLDAVKHRLRIDEKRVYVTGLSMGGFGTWGLIGKAPEQFAAAVPICGGGSTRDFLPPLVRPRYREALQSLPIWAFHGGKDTVVLPEESQRLVAMMDQRVKGNAKLTIYPDAGHDSWTKTYNNAELYTWLLSHAR
jgi:predicted peptidase